MPLIGPITEGHGFFCPRCGALYAVTYSRKSNRDSNTARCVVCGQIMATWDTTNVPTYKLVHRSEDA
jgi:transcription elongation factor Elf1